MKPACLFLQRKRGCKVDKVKKDSRRDWFFSYNLVFELDLSCHAKLVYIYLCRCADSEAQSFPSKNTISRSCGISVSSVKYALRELIEARLLTREEQFRANKGQTSNLYTIYSQPYEVEALPETETTPCSEIDNEGLTKEEAVDKAVGQQSENSRPKYDPQPGQNISSPRSKCAPQEVLPTLSTSHKEVNTS